METTPLNEEIRTRMRQYRIAAGRSVFAMAELLHMDERNYKRIESGERKLIDLELVDRFCQVLDIPVYSFLLGSTVLPHIHILAMQQWAAVHQLRKTLMALEQMLQLPPAQGATG